MRSKEVNIEGLLYTIYENGDVYRGNRKITQRPCYHDGYASFTAGKRDSRRSIRTHTIVGKLFVENPNNLPELDFQKLTQAIDKLNSYIGINTAIDLTCDKCGGDIRTYFRFGSEFFRPTNI